MIAMAGEHHRGPVAVSSVPTGSANAPNGLNGQLIGEDPPL
jgi:hypothetical protein